MMKIKIAETAQKYGIKSAYGLQKALEISPTIAARLWKGEFDKIGIKTLERLCDYFYCQPNDFLEYTFTQSDKSKTKNNANDNPQQEEKYYYNKSALKERGWTGAMIRDLLSDVEIKQGLTCSAGQAGFNFKYYYEDSKVEAIEKTKAFKEWKQKKSKA